LLEAMQELAVTVNGKTYRLDPPFVVVATQNPIEQEGTYPLPEAQLDRFMLSIHVSYPRTRTKSTSRPGPFAPRLRPHAILTREDFQGFTDIVDQMPASRHVLEHAVAHRARQPPKDERASDFVRRYVAWGAGPRATQHLVTAAKAAALIDGRPRRR
jgi:MoxR-like ATPase